MAQPHSGRCQQRRSLILHGYVTQMAPRWDRLARAWQACENWCSSRHYGRESCGTFSENETTGGPEAVSRSPRLIRFALGIVGMTLSLRLEAGSAGLSEGSEVGPTRQEAPPWVPTSSATLRRPAVGAIATNTVLQSACLSSRKEKTQSRTHMQLLFIAAAVGDKCGLSALNTAERAAGSRDGSGLGPGLQKQDLFQDPARRLDMNPSRNKAFPCKDEARPT